MRRVGHTWGPGGSKGCIQAVTEVLLTAYSGAGAGAGDSGWVMCGYDYLHGIVNRDGCIISPLIWGY